MRGVVFIGDRELELREFPDPIPGPDEAIVAIKASGMCGSDLHSYRQPRSVRTPDRQCIAGHEPCGVVAARGVGVGEEEAPIGRRVMIHHYKNCGQCRHCRVGYSQMCLRGSITYGVNGDGAHADYMRVKPGMLVPLDEALSFEEGAAISCGTGTAYLGLKRLGVSGRDTVAVFGQGPVGVSGTLLGKAMGARIIAVDPASERRALAQQLGADVVLDPREVDPAEAIRELTHGEGADGALDTSGSPDGRNAALKSVRIWGQVCFVGIGPDTTFAVNDDIIHKQLSVYGSWTFSTVGQADCAQFVLDHKLPLGSIFTHRYNSLDRAAEAYKLFDTQTTGKGVFLL